MKKIISSKAVFIISKSITKTVNGIKKFYQSYVVENRPGITFLSFDREQAKKFKTMSEAQKEAKKISKDFNVNIY